MPVSNPELMLISTEASNPVSTCAAVALMLVVLGRRVEEVLPLEVLFGRWPGRDVNVIHIEVTQLG